MGIYGESIKSAVLILTWSLGFNNASKCCLNFSSVGLHSGWSSSSPFQLIDFQIDLESLEFSSLIHRLRDVSQTFVLRARDLDENLYEAE